MSEPVEIDPVQWVGQGGGVSGSRDLSFHIGFIDDSPVSHAGVVQNCPLCNVLGPRCREADFIGMSHWVRCALPAHHEGMCDIQPVRPVPLDDPTSVALIVFAVLMLGACVGFALGVCATISFGW